MDFRWIFFDFLETWSFVLYSLLRTASTSKNSLFLASFRPSKHKFHLKPGLQACLKEECSILHCFTLFYVFLMFSFCFLIFLFLFQLSCALCPDQPASRQGYVSTPRSPQEGDFLTSNASKAGVYWRVMERYLSFSDDVLLEAIPKQVFWGPCSRRFLTSLALRTLRVCRPCSTYPRLPGLPGFVYMSYTALSLPLGFWPTVGAESFVSSFPIFHLRTNWFDLFLFRCFCSGSSALFRCFRTSVTF